MTRPEVLKVVGQLADRYTLAVVDRRVFAVVKTHAAL
jgi:hypothetical protein